MPKISFKSVDQYLAAQPEPMRLALERVRRTIRKAMPGAEEVISYKMPAYKMHGRIVLYFAGWKQHYSLYPAGAQLGPEFQEELAAYKLSKGAIRFPLDQPVPVKLIARIAKFRAKQASS